MATKPAEPEEPKAPPKSKKLLLIVGVALLAVALAGAAGWWFLGKQRAPVDAEEEEVVAKVAHKGPPTFLPLESMVVNLANPGGEKVAQIGITLELADAHATETVKQYLPAIRSAILLLASQRTAEELLSREGKEKLAADILQEATRPFAVADEGAVSAKDRKDAGATKKKKSKKEDKAQDESPVRAVLFSSFIVQ